MTANGWQADTRRGLKVCVARRRRRPRHRLVPFHPPVALPGTASKGHLADYADQQQKQREYGQCGHCEDQQGEGPPKGAAARQAVSAAQLSI